MCVCGQQLNIEKIKTERENGSKRDGDKGDPKSRNKGAVCSANARASALKLRQCQCVVECRETPHFNALAATQFENFSGALSLSEAQNRTRF